MTISLKNYCGVAFGAMVFLFTALFATSAVAQGAQQERRLGSAAVPGKPVYNPATKSYFELRIDLPSPPNWGTAVRYARTRTFKGVRGRLAVVKDLQTHSFLRANFDVREEAWIGLRYFCSFRKLVWADGDEHPRTAFKMWAKKWHRTDIRCGKQRINYMPVYYQRSSLGFKWQASGPAKYFVSYFVEYPTGAENPQKEAPKAKTVEPAVGKPKAPKPGAPAKQTPAKPDT